jgi:hypothetical protein
VRGRERERDRALWSQVGGGLSPGKGAVVPGRSDDISTSL